MTWMKITHTHKKIYNLSCWGCIKKTSLKKNMYMSDTFIIWCCNNTNIKFSWRIIVILDVLIICRKQLGNHAYISMHTNGLWCVCTKRFRWTYVVGSETLCVPVVFDKYVQLTSWTNIECCWFRNLRYNKRTSGLWWVCIKWTSWTRDSCGFSWNRSSSDSCWVSGGPCGRGFFHVHTLKHYSENKNI